MARNFEVWLERTVNYSCAVIVSIPDSVSDKDAENFIESNLDIESIDTYDMEEWDSTTEIDSVENAEDSALVDIDFSDAEQD